MKKIYFTFLCTLLTCMSWVGCSDGDTPVEPSISITGETSQTLGTAGGKITVTFTSAKEWTAKSDQSWCRVSLASGQAGTVTLGITVSENTSEDDRVAKVTLLSETVSKVITITQKQKDALIVANKEYTLKSDATTLTFKVNTNVNELKIGTTASWIHLPKSKARAMVEVPLSFEIDENTTNKAREGIITISLTNDDLRQVIKVTQEGKVIKSIVSIIHTNMNMMIPIITGQNVSGIVNWGDDKQEEYKSNLVHSYSEEKQYTLVLDVIGADNIEVPSLEGVIELDLSKF